MSSTVFTQQDIYIAAQESFDKHGKDRDVIAFNKDLEGNVARLYESVVSGNLDDVISFRQLTKVNSNGVKALIGVTDENHPGKELAFEFHGNYQGIIRWLRELEKVYPNRDFLPIEDARITNQCGYIFEGSSNQMEFI